MVQASQEEAEAVDSSAVTLDKISTFNKELEYIKDERIKESAKILINKVPDYFFHEAASSTGKYHPAFSQGEAGLVRHTKAAVRIAKEILSTETFGDFYTDNEKDLVIVSLIMHDTIKRGEIEERYTRADHPLLASEFIKKYASETKLTDEEVKLICSMIETHMGQWNTDYNGNVIMEKPKTKYQRLVHLCDLLSSKKFLDIKFDKNNDILY